MDENKGGRDGSGDPFDAVLRGFLRQGRLDPQAERLAAQGLDRLKAFLGTSGGDDDTTTEVAEVLEEDLEPRRAMLMHTIPLTDGTRVEVLVPEAMTRAEAERIAGVLAALAVD